MSSFLEELWNEEAEVEHYGETAEGERRLKEEKEERSLEPYEAIKAIPANGRLTPEKKNMAEKLVKGFDQAALRYLQAMDQLAYTRLAKDEEKEAGDFDLARRQAHDALISNLNVLSRFCRGNGIDNNWRSVVGLDRKEVSEWIKTISGELGKGGEQ